MHFCHKSALLLLPELKIFTNVTEVVDLLDSIGHCWTTLVVIGGKWRLSQCRFGEHLPQDKVNANVALVESENTAVICFLLMPGYVWLATGGKSQIGDKLNVLHQRTIVAFPDVDGYELWKQKAEELSSLRITVSDYLESRDRLRASERQLSLNIYERGVDDKGFGRIRSKGDAVLFGGNTTEDMNKRLGVKDNRPLADFLPTLTIAAKNLATEMTNYNVEGKNLYGKTDIT